MMEEWRKSLDVGGYAGALLTELSKESFDRVNHEMLIAK